MAYANARHEQREAWVDGLRGGVTLLVVAHHCALMYGARGTWYWHERAPDNSLPSLLLTLFCTLNQTWFMGLFFLLAGMYVPGALARKGAFQFLLDRTLRLGIPLLFFGCLLAPLTIALAWTSQGIAIHDSLMALWLSRTFEPGPQWFTAALLAMTVLITPAVQLFQQQLQGQRPFPSNIGLLLVALAVGVAAFLIRFPWPVGTTWFLGWQLGYFPSYVVLFIAGVMGASSRWWLAVPIASARTWRWVMRCAVGVFPVVALLGSTIPALTGPATGGWNVQAAVYAFWEPLVAWGILLGLLRWARQRWHHPTPWCKAMGRCAFTIFLIHPPIVVAMGLALQSWGMPVLLKFALSAALSILIALAIASLLLRIPLWRRWF